ncbi:MAG: hypothetical protein PHR35_04830 [Kiritimatiellae bacterium]|nr:hypothetical protein [Kiritimatiellia bacterium]
MWPFTRRRRNRGLEGISGQLWSYDERSGSRWRLDVPGERPLRRASRSRPSGGYGGEAPLQQGKLRHYIAAGGMRQMRVRRPTRKAVARPDMVWRIFAGFALYWLLFRLVTV